MKALFPFRLLAPGKYQVAITWPTAPVNFYGTTYTPSTATQFNVTNAAGTVLGTFSIDQTKPPADYTSQGVAWKVLGSYSVVTYGDSLSLNMTTAGLSNPAPGGTGAAAFIDAVQLTRTSADTSITVAASDVATLTIPSGWVTTATGPVPSLVALPVIPPSATTIMPAIASGSKSMRLGYNFFPSSYYTTFPTHNNQAHRLFSTGFGLAQNSDGYPTKMPSQDGLLGYVSGYNWDQHAGNHQQVPQINEGLFLMTWDGDQGLYLQGSHQVTEQLQYQSLTGGVGNRRVYQIRTDPRSLSASFSLNFRSTVPDSTDPTGKAYLCNISNLKIYPPNPADSTGNTIWGWDPATNLYSTPPKFAPDFLNKLQGMQCIRFMDALWVNHCPVGRFSDFKAVTHVSRCDYATNVKIAVTKVQPPSGPRYLPDNVTAIVQLTTATPHNLYTGVQISLSGCGTANFVDASGNPSSQDIDTWGPVVVLDATNLLFLSGGVASGAPGNGGTMTNTLTPTSGSLVAQYGSAWPLQDIVDLAAAVPGLREIWFNIAVTSDTSVGGCVDQVAAFLAKNLPAGIKIHVEFGNECWNGTFQSRPWCAMQSARMTNNSASLSRLRALLRQPDACGSPAVQSGVR